MATVASETRHQNHPHHPAVHALLLVFFLSLATLMLAIVECCCRETKSSSCLELSTLCSTPLSQAASSTSSTLRRRFDSSDQMSARFPLLPASARYFLMWRLSLEQQPTTASSSSSFANAPAHFFAFLQRFGEAEIHFARSTVRNDSMLGRETFGVYFVDRRC